VDLLAIASGVIQGSIQLAQEEGAEAGLQINLFWVIVSSLNFIVFAVVVYWLFGGPLSRMLKERRERVEQGMRDAEQARRDRESAEAERLEALQEARREANEIITRAQKVSQDARDADIAATKAELERLRDRATSDIEAEKQRAITELRSEVTDLALTAAGKVVGETLSTDRERRLVAEFLAETGQDGSGGSGSGASGSGGSGSGASGSGASGSGGSPRGSAS
jgi:F-type H+-transporting ATPase subunit b